MATRQAAIRLSLRSGAFQAEFRKLQGQVAAGGRKMGSSLRTSISAGLTAARTQLAGFGSQLKGHIKTAGALAGAVSFGMLIKDAMSIQGIYRNIAFDVAKIPGEAFTWRDAQEIVDKAVRRTGQSAEDMAKAFHTVYKATGDLEYSRRVLDAVGYTATASGVEVDRFATAAQMLLRKFNITAEEAPDALAKMAEMTNSGALSVDDLGGRFGMMAGEAKMAGMTGVKGMTDLLGMFRLLDAEMGEKLTPALTMMFQLLKSGTTYAKEFKKAGVEFKPDEAFLDKFRRLLEGKGRIIAEEKFTGVARGAFDLLVAPFDEALKEAQTKGLKRGEAVDYAMKRFDESFRKASSTTWDFQLIMDRARKRMEEDPTLKLKDAINKMRESFASPRMISAITRMSETLPPLAEKFAELLAWMLENPWKAAGIAAGYKALPIAAAALGGGAAMRAAPAAIAGKLATAGRMAPLATGAAGTAAAAGTALALAGAAGAAGAGVGYGAFKLAVEPQMEADFARLRSIDETMMSVDHALRRKNVEETRKSLGEVRAQIKKAEEGPGFFTAYFGGMAKMFGADVKSAEEDLANKTLALSTAEYKLQRQVELLERQMRLAADGAQRLKDAMPPPGAARGPGMGAQPPPGAEPKAG